MIRSFKCTETQRLFDGHYSRRLSADLQRVAARRLEMLDAAPSLQALMVPPSNRLEKLRGDWAGSYSIRINRRWRICFQWIDGNAHAVEIIDYHD